MQRRWQGDGGLLEQGGTAAVTLGPGGGDIVLRCKNNQVSPSTLYAHYASITAIKVGQSTPA